MYSRDKSLDWVYIAKGIATVLGTLFVIVAIIWGVNFGWRGYQRWQSIQDANNQVQLNEIQIKQTAQLVQVENQKAAIRVADAKGIAESQKIINDTLTPLYLQHEAIQAQQSNVNSNNHTIVYIPTGNEGIPLVGTVNTSNP